MTDGAEEGHVRDKQKMGGIEGPEAMYLKWFDTHQ